MISLAIIAAYLRYERSAAEQADIALQTDGKEALPGSALNSPQVQDPGLAAIGPLKGIDLHGLYQDAQDPSKIEYEERLKTAMEGFKSSDYLTAARIFRELSEKEKSACKGAGFSYFRLGDMTNAIGFLEKAVEHNGSDFAVRKILAFAYYKTDNIEKSLQHAAAGLSISKDEQLQTLFEKLGRDMKAQQGYVHESSDHFKVIYNGYNHGSLDREIAGILEDAYRHIGNELDYFPSEAVTVILYTDREFRDTTLAPVWSGGIYDGKIRLPVKDMEGQAGILRKVLFHEYTHAVVHSLSANCPLWINEGLAEYFSGVNPGKIGQVIPLTRLERSFDGLNANNVGIAYAESYSAVSWLIERHGAYKVKDMLMSVSNGGDIEKAFQGSFGTTYSAFVSEWGRQ